MVAQVSVRQRFANAGGALDSTIFRMGRKAPKQTAPRGLAPETVRAEVVQKLEAMDGIIAQCESRFGHGKVLDHPILGPLTAAQWRKFHWIHGHHHVKQILKLRERARSEAAPATIRDSK